MLEQHRHLANECEDIVNLQGADAYCVATCTVCLDLLYADLFKQNWQHDIMIFSVGSDGFQVWGRLLCPPRGLHRRYVF